MIMCVALQKKETDEEDRVNSLHLLLTWWCYAATALHCLLQGGILFLLVLLEVSRTLT